VWDTWHGALPEDQQKLISDHEGSLKKALDSERDARKEKEESLRKVAGELEKGSEAQKKVLELADSEAAANLKADFYEDAHGKNVSDLRLAYLAAKEADLFDRKGNCDFEKLKELHPGLFAKKFVPEGGGGEGTGSRDIPKNVSMNDMIRKKAGR